MQNATVKALADNINKFRLRQRADQGYRRGTDSPEFRWTNGTGRERAGYWMLDTGYWMLDQLFW